MKKFEVSIKDTDGGTFAVDVEADTEEDSKINAVGMLRKALLKQGVLVDSLEVLTVDEVDEFKTGI